MIRYPSFLIIFVILFLAISLYQIKHLITKKEIELAQIKANINGAKSDLNILKAELSYLKRPDRIEKIALSKLGLKEILPTDIWDLKDLINITDSLNDGEHK
jgi:cell division protein FtsL